MEVVFAKFLDLLHQRRVEYLLVGGLAVILNGYVRVTEDVDILIPRDEDNILRLIETMKGIGEGYGGELTLADFEDTPGALRVIESYPIDIFLQMAGLHYEDLMPYCQIHDEKGTPVPYLSAEGLMILKKDSHRDKDQNDMIALRDLVKQRKAYNLLNSGEPTTRHGWRAWLRGPDFWKNRGRPK
jgi:hypothetical protein